MLAATCFCWWYLRQVLFKLSKSFILEQKSGHFSVSHEGEHRIVLREQRLAIIVAQKQAAEATEIHRVLPTPRGAGFGSWYTPTYMPGVCDGVLQSSDRSLVRLESG